MAIDLLKDRGTPLDKQRFTWRELASPPYRKLNDEAFTRVRVILMNGVESEANRFSHAMARMTPNPALQLLLARVRRVEQHQQTMVNWLNPADQNPLETTIGFEQVAIEVTAALAQNEPDAYLAQAYRFGLLEDFDHMYRFAALYDRLEGKDANVLLQSYTDILPGRPTSVEHRAPEDDLRLPYEAQSAEPVTRLNALTLVAAENQTHDYYMTIGPMFADPLARQLYAEIASIEEQHVTHYESLIDASETPLEKWVLHEAMEVYNYLSCAMSEPNPRIRGIWERFVDYELGHLAEAREALKSLEDTDPAELLPRVLPVPISFESQRDFVRFTLKKEVDLRAHGTQFVDKAELPENSPSHAYRETMNAEGSPSEKVAAGYVWTPGTELAIAAMPAHARGGNGRQKP
jgi:rubrerythrin